MPNIFIHNLICIDIGLKMSLNKEDKKILKYDGRPFFVEEIMEALND